MCVAAHIYALVMCNFVASSAYAEILFSSGGAGPIANLYAIDASGNLKKITDNIRWRDVDADMASDGRIVFSSNREVDPKIDLSRRSEKFHLYLTDIAGVAPSVLTSGDTDERMPRFSPDGNDIAFIRRSGNSQQLVLMALGGEEKTIVSADEIFDFSWSPDGSQLAVALRNGFESELSLLEASGSEQAKTLARAEGNEWIVAARWSPSGRHIALIRHPLRKSDRQLSVLNIDSGREWRLSPDGAEVQQPLNWSSDGKRLLYAALVDYRYHYDEKAHKKVYQGAMHLFLSSLNGETRRLTEDHGLHTSPVFSPDEKKIAFLYARELDARRLVLRTMSLSGGEVRELYSAVARRSGVLWRKSSRG